MTRDDVNTLCQSLPGSEVSDPWGGGHCCWKVGGKMYSNIGSLNEGVTLKCADTATAEMLIDIGRAERHKYLQRGGWIFVRWGVMDADELTERIRTSYAKVRAGLPKAARDALPPVD